VDKVTIIGGTYFQLVAGHLSLNLFAKVLVNPAYIGDRQIPFNIAQDDEIVNPRVPVLMEVS